MPKKNELSTEIQTASNTSMEVSGFTPLMNINGVTYAVEKTVTRQLLKQDKDETVYVEFLREAYRKVDDDGNPVIQAGMPAPWVAVVRNLALPGSNEEFDYLLPTVLAETLFKNYPGDSYVGKLFAIYRNLEKGGKGATKYNLYSIVELKQINQEAAE